MSYSNLRELIPKELIEQIQQYIDGQVIYIPKKQINKKRWGEDTDTKQYLTNRNIQICLDFQDGKTIKCLAEKYFLSEKSIQRIIKQKRI